MMKTYVDETNSVKATKPVLTGLVLGGLIGAATVLLFAPQSGQRTRAEIRQGAMDLRDRATATVNETVSQVKTKKDAITSSLISKADELKHRGQDLVARQLDRVSQAAEAGKKAVEQA
jgi:gas vesicle protein